MNLQQGVALLTLLGLFTSTSGHVGGALTAQPDKPRNYCGRVLATALAMLCYEDETPDKRSGNGYMYNNLQPNSYHAELQEAEYDRPWLSALKARSLSSGARNKRQYIVSECCEKACTVQELMTYC